MSPSGSASGTVVTYTAPASHDTFEGDGFFKSPTLRNVELTAPYFHNGGTLTLAENSPAGAVFELSLPRA